MDCLAAVCQMRPRLGVLTDNLAAHHDWLDRCQEAGADLAVFPELSLTGYFLRDLTQEIAMPLDAKPVKELVARSKDMSIVFGMVEVSRDHRFYNSMVFAEDGKILHVHRKVHLPDYGIFEEGRYFASGDGFLPVHSRLGRFGLLVCEDAWHLSSGYMHFLQGVDALLLAVASPARGIDTDEPELSSHGAWRTLSEAQALFFQTWVVRANRVGFEDGTMFWGASSVVSPFGKTVVEGSGDQEELLLQRLSSDPLRRARMATPLLRDAKPDMVRRQLAQLLHDPDALRPPEGDAPPSS